jgi:hypothetical protein
MITAAPVLARDWGVSLRVLITPSMLENTATLEYTFKRAYSLLFYLEIG